MKFDPSFRQQVCPQILPLLDRFEEIEATLATLNADTILWQPPEALPDLLDHYLDALFRIYIHKFHVLCQSLIQALNAGNFLIYGLIGRSLIEHTAILRYYVTNKMLPLAQAAAADGEISEAELEELIHWLNRHLTGQRFDWDVFLADYFAQLEQPRTRHALRESQVNVITCLEKWIQERAAIAQLYELFCDLVHPNLGSNLLISRLVEDQIGIGGSLGEPIGLEIMNRTFADLVALFEEVRDQLLQLKSLKFSEIISLAANAENSNSISL